MKKILAKTVALSASVGLLVLVAMQDFAPWLSLAQVSTLAALGATCAFLAVALLAVNTDFFAQPGAQPVHRKRSRVGPTHPLHQLNRPKRERQQSRQLHPNRTVISILWGMFHFERVTFQPAMVGV